MYTFNNSKQQDTIAMQAIFKMTVRQQHCPTAVST